MSKQKFTLFQKDKLPGWILKYLPEELITVDEPCPTKEVLVFSLDKNNNITLIANPDMKPELEKDLKKIKNYAFLKKEKMDPERKDFVTNYYVSYVNKNHTVFTPTLNVDTYGKNCLVELLLCHQGDSRYYSFEILLDTKTPSIIDVINEEFLSTIIPRDDTGTYHVDFYNMIGQQRNKELKTFKALKSCITSIRVVDVW